MVHSEDLALCLDRFEIIFVLDVCHVLEEGAIQGCVVVEIRYKPGEAVRLVCEVNFQGQTDFWRLTSNCISLTTTNFFGVVVV